MYNYTQKSKCKQEIKKKEWKMLDTDNSSENMNSK